MSNPAAPPSIPGAPWRILVLDRSGDDPKWIIATVALSSDVQGATLLPNGLYTGWPAVTQWVSDQVGQRVRLASVAAIVWRIDIERGNGS